MQVNFYVDVKYGSQEEQKCTCFEFNRTLRSHQIAIFEAEN